MAANVSLDPDLLEEAFRLSGEPTKKAAVTRALQEFIAQPAVSLLVDTSAWSLALRRDGAEDAP